MSNPQPQTGEPRRPYVRPEAHALVVEYRRAGSWSVSCSCGRWTMHTVTYLAGVDHHAEHVRVQTIGRRR